MKPSQFSVFGFGVRIEPFFALLAFYVFFNTGSNYVMGAAIVATFAVSVLIHELGHAFAFRRYGYESAIVLHGLGGYTAPLQRTTMSNGRHLFVSLAGPLTQMIGLGVPAYLLSQRLDLSGTPAEVLSLFVVFNLAWGAINLLPVMPLDGGNIMYRGLTILTGRNQIQTARLVSAAVAVPIAIGAYVIGYVFVALGAAYFAATNLMSCYNHGKPASQIGPRDFAVPPPQAPPTTDQGI